MADSPGKVLSSFALSNEKEGNNSKLGGCACVFFQILDRFNGKKFLPHKLLPSERPKQKTIRHTVQKLPMAKLLLIADEKRIADSLKDKEILSDAVSHCSWITEGQKKTSVSVVARLMGLDTMPSPQPSTKRKQIGALKEKAEARFTMKLLQHKKVPNKIDQRHSITNTRIQRLKRTMTPQTNHQSTLEVKATSSNCATVALNSSLASSELNSSNGEDPRDAILTKLPLPSSQAEFPLRSIIPPSRSSNNLLSPIKSSLSSRSTAQLIGAAARVLEPSLRPARHLAVSSPKAKGATCGTADGHDKEQETVSRQPTPLSSSNVAFVECKGQVTSRHLNPTPKKVKKFPLDATTLSRPPDNKDRVRKIYPQAKQEKRPYKMATVKKNSTIIIPCKPQTDASNGEGSLIVSNTHNKSFGKSARVNKQENMLEAVLVREEVLTDKDSTRAVRPQISLVPPGSRLEKGSSKCTTFQPSRSGRYPEIHFSLSHTSADVLIQEHSRSTAKARSARNIKFTSGCNNNSTGAHSRTDGAQLKRESSCSRSFSKRKASSLSAKPADLPNTSRAEEAGVKLENAGNERNVQRIGSETQNNFLHNDSSSSAVPLFEDCNTASSSEAELRGRTRVRARWDIIEGKKKSLTISRISCNSSTLRPLSLGIPDHKLVFCKDEPEALSDNNAKCGRGMTALLSECYTEHQSSSSDSVSVEDDFDQDYESVSGSLCIEEQPSPISILESPFLDSASCSSDSFEAPQGIKLWEAIEEEGVDAGCTVIDSIEDVRSHYVQTDRKSFTHVVSQSYCIDSGSCAECRITENEKYVNQILGIVLVSYETAEWERRAFSGPVIDPLIYYQLEDNFLAMGTATTTKGSSKDFEHENNLCGTRTHINITTAFKEPASQQRRLLFNCVEVALKLGLELALQSYRFQIPFKQCPPTYLKETVHKHLGEWKGLAVSMNFDDMMKVEINTGMERWFKYGDEVDNVAATVEAMIFRGLIDELTKEMMVKRQASCVCS